MKIEYDCSLSEAAGIVLCLKEGISVLCGTGEKLKYFRSGISFKNNLMRQMQDERTRNRFLEITLTHTEPFHYDDFYIGEKFLVKLADSGLICVMQLCESENGESYLCAESLGKIFENDFNLICAWEPIKRFEVEEKECRKVQ